MFVDIWRIIVDVWRIIHHISLTNAMNYSSNVHSGICFLKRLKYQFVKISPAPLTFHSNIVKSNPYTIWRKWHLAHDVIIFHMTNYWGQMSREQKQTSTLMKKLTCKMQIWCGIYFFAAWNFCFSNFFAPKIVLLNFVFQEGKFFDAKKLPKQNFRAAKK